MKTKEKQSEKKTKPLYIFLHLPKNGGGTLNQNVIRKLKSSKISNSINVKNLSNKRKKDIEYIYDHDIYYGIHKYFPNREARYIIFIRDSAERRVSQYNHDMSRLNKHKEMKKNISFKKWYKLQMKNEQVFLCNKKFKGISGRKAPSFTNKIITKFDIGHNRILKMAGYRLLKVLDVFRKSNKNEKKELENAKKLLDNCWFVSTTKNLDKDIPIIFKELGIKTGNKIERYRTAKKEGEKFMAGELGATKFFELDANTRQGIYKDNPLDLELYEYARKFTGGKKD